MICGPAAERAEVLGRSEVPHELENRVGPDPDWDPGGGMRGSGRTIFDRTRAVSAACEFRGACTTESSVTPPPSQR